MSRPAAPVLPTPTAPPPAPERGAIRRAARARRRVLAGELRGVRPAVRRRRLAVVGVALVALLVTCGPALLAVSPAFGVRTLSIDGASAPTGDAIRAALGAELGRPIALVSDDDVARDLATVAAVGSFTVERRPPSTLDVRVVLRTAIAQRPTATGWQQVDAAGVVLAEQQAQFDGLPVVRLAAGAPDAAFAAAVAALRALAGAQGVQVDRVTASTADDVRLRLAGGPAVIWGSADDGAAKAQALAAALVQASRGARTIDVSSPGVVVTR